jgi:hypothetical protein
LQLRISLQSSNKLIFETQQLSKLLKSNSRF